MIVTGRTLDKLVEKLKRWRVRDFNRTQEGFDQVRHRQDDTDDAIGNGRKEHQ